MLHLFGFDIVFRHAWLFWQILLPLAAVCAGIAGYLVITAYRAAKREVSGNPFLRLHQGEVHVLKRTYVFLWAGITLLLLLLFAVCAEPERRVVAKDPVYGGIRVAFMLDVSYSMKYAHDVDPFPDRLVAAKSVLADFATMTRADKDLRGTYKLALIPFAGTAMTYLPFSASIEEFIEAVDAIDSTAINDPGSNLFFPYLAYEEMLKAHPRADERVLDIAVLLSDGGKGEGAHLEVPRINALKQRMPHAHFFTVGIGSVRVERDYDGKEFRRTVPVELKKLDARGNLVEYLRENPSDPKSPIMRSELDERVLQSVAGDPSRYFFYQGKERLLADLKQMIFNARVPTEYRTHERLTPIAHWFLIPALLIGFLLFGYAGRLFFLLSRPLKAMKRTVIPARG